MDKDQIIGKECDRMGKNDEFQFGMGLFFERERSVSFFHSLRSFSFLSSNDLFFDASHCIATSFVTFSAFIYV